MKKYLKDALSIYSLEEDLQNIAEEENKDIENFTVEEILKEAIYLIDLYNQSSTSYYEDLHSTDKELRNETKEELKELKSFVRKYHK